MALSAIYRSGQRYGAAYLIDVLRGNANATVKERGHENLSVFGIGHALSELEWRSLFRQLVALGWVEVDTAGYGTLRLANAARPVLRGEMPALETAATDNVPAYVILHDRVLREIALDRPSSLAGLGRISGIGENKLRRFGERLLALVNDI